MVKYSAKAKIILKDSWDILKTNIDNDVFLVRVRRGLNGLVGHPDYQWVAQAAVYLNSPTKNIPDDEVRDISRIEKRLCTELEEANEAILVAVSISPRIYEFVFYTSNVVKTRNKLNSIQRTIRSHQVSTVIQPDPNWTLSKRTSIRESEN